MNTIEEVKKVVWILGFIRSNLKSDSVIRIKMETCELNGYWPEGMTLPEDNAIGKLFDKTDLPLLYVEITWLEQKILTRLEIIIRENTIVLVIQESHDEVLGLPLNPALRGVCPSMETFRREILPVIMNHVSEYKSGEALQTFHDIRKFMLLKCK